MTATFAQRQCERHQRRSVSSTNEHPQESDRGGTPSARVRDERVGSRSRLRPAPTRASRLAGIRAQTRLGTVLSCRRIAKPRDRRCRPGIGYCTIRGTGPRGPIDAQQSSIWRAARGCKTAPLSKMARPIHLHFFNAPQGHHQWRSCIGPTAAACR